MKTIITADGLMGLENILAIAGAAQGNYSFVVLGLFISVPIIIRGSKIIFYLLFKYPYIIYIGSVVLPYTIVI